MVMLPDTTSVGALSAARVPSVVNNPAGSRVGRESPARDRARSSTIIWRWPFLWMTGSETPIESIRLRMTARAPGVNADNIRRASSSSNTLTARRRAVLRSPLNLENREALERLLAKYSD